MQSYKEHIVTNEELKMIQKIDLEMLVEVDRICRKYRIRYSLDGGTLLGAVRHKGFIPWDDDADVIMLRKEYRKFQKACKKELDQSRFFLQDYQTDPEYRWGYAKIRRKNTEYIRLGQEHLKQKGGVCIDIFVADNVPDQKVARNIHYFFCYCIRKTMYAPLGAKNEKNSLLRMWYVLLNRIPIKIVFRARNILAYHSNKKRTKLISHYTFPYPKSCKYGLPRACFDKFIELEFEGRKFQAFKDYHTYLSMHYGEYMKLPPKDKRVCETRLSTLKLKDVDV
ncbi:MAG: LicD family protein [Lachnospiraceae bacterium]|nr:LicD family protein [Lachnospiraceae bacterium]